MQNTPRHEFELYHPEMFKVLLAHEVNNSRRYGDSLTLVNLRVETNPAHPETRNEAEKFATHMLHQQLRDTDVSCKQENEFLILMPSTSAPGARTACARIKKIVCAEHRAENGTLFELSVFAGMASLPVDHPITSDEFTQNASQALQHALANRSSSVIAFSEIPK